MEPDRIKALVRCRRISSGTNTPRSFTFHPDGNYLYFLAADASTSLTDTPPSTLYAVNIPKHLKDDQPSSAKVQWKSALPQTPVTSTNTTTTNNNTTTPTPNLLQDESETPGEKEKIIPPPQTKPAEDTDVSAATAAAAAQAKEIALIRERKRTVAHGLTEFSVHSSSKQILLPLANALYVASCNDDATTSTNDDDVREHPILSPQPVGSSPSLSIEDGPDDDDIVPPPPPAPFLDPKISPDGSMVAFVRDADIWVTDLKSGRERRLTDSRPQAAVSVPTTDGHGNIEPNNIVNNMPTGPEGGVSEPRARSCGVAEYVMQEEFDRFSGFWWSPSKDPSTAQYDLLYLAVDQAEVPVVRVPHYSLDDAAEHYHYPRPGDSNAQVTPCVIPVPQPPSSSGEDAVNALNSWASVDAKKYADEHAWTPKVPIQQQYQWAEYVVRAGWLPSSDDDDVNENSNRNRNIYGVRGFWLALLDRRQMRMEVVAFPAFGDGHGTVVLAMRSHDWWINVDDNLRFLKKKRALLYTSETRNGCAHLYYKRVPSLGEQIGGPPSPPKQSEKKEKVPLADVATITSANYDDEWIVESIAHVDEERQLVFYNSTKTGPLERQLCVSSYHHADGDSKDNKNNNNNIKPEDNVRPLSEAGYMITGVQIDPLHNRVVFNASNTTTEVRSQVFKITGLVTPDAGAPQKLADISLVPLVTIENPTMHPSNLPPWPFVAPELFSFAAEDGTKLHGAVYLPHSVAGRKLDDVKGPFPTILSVYAGPQVQVVRNERRLTKVMKNQMLAAMGYAVVMIDGRGSYRRGVRFESVLKGKFGGAELRDQVAGIEELISKGIVDKKRIAVTGWSYGAYAGTMLLARYSNLFKIAICGAPVTRWEGYDAAYTERYLGLPDENAAGYAASSVVSYAEAFPTENGRLMLVHSLMDENVHASHTVALVDELIKRNKQHTLLLFPRERHGLRDPAAQRHFETAFFNYLNANMP